jgi:hypothetical protein
MDDGSYLRWPAKAVVFVLQIPKKKWFDPPDTLSNHRLFLQSRPQADPLEP